MIFGLIGAIVVVALLIVGAFWVIDNISVKKASINKKVKK